MENVNLELSNLSGANATSANLTRANFYKADFSNINLNSARLDYANLEDIVWKGRTGEPVIESIAFANIFGVQNPPAGFIDWALANGAVEAKNDAEYFELVVKRISSQSTN